MADTDAPFTFQWPDYNGVCEAPDLGDLPFLSLAAMIRRGFVDGGPKDGTQHALVMNFVRIVDKVVIDYGHAREALQNWVSEPNGLGYAFLASGYFESCFAGMGRALKFAKAIRASPLAAKLAAVDFGVLDGEAGRRVNKVRNAVEHLDERVTDGVVVADGEFRCMMPVKGGIRLKPEFVTYTELASWIRQLHAVAAKVAEYRESSAP